MDRYGQRNRGLTLLLQAFFLFMVVNGAIVFAHGPARWLGIGVVVVIAIAGISKWRAENKTPQQHCEG